jgi:hypothetical protein
MHVLSSTPGSPDDELWPIVHLHLANLPEGLLPFKLKELLDIYHTDRSVYTSGLAVTDAGVRLGRHRRRVTGLASKASGRLARV